jgi:hypothetical protein
MEVEGSDAAQEQLTVGKADNDSENEHGEGQSLPPLPSAALPREAREWLPLPLSEVCIKDDATHESRENEACTHARYNFSKKKPYILTLCCKYSKVLTLENFLCSKASEGWVDTADVMDLIAQFEKSWDSVRVLLPRLAPFKKALGEAGGEGAIPGTFFFFFESLSTKRITGEFLRISQNVRGAERARVDRVGH